MLENIDLDKTLDQATYKARMDDLSERLYFAQRKSWEAGIPVIILFEGWDAAGKGTTIHKLTDPIDPRGYKIYPIRAARTYEKKRPWLWRFWLKIPARGEWAIFDRSWYGRVLVERRLKLTPKDDWQRAYRDIVDFERTLADDGALIIKFFLHISKKEQGRRFHKLEQDPLNAWRVTSEDRDNHKHYQTWLKVFEEMLERTDSEWGPWTIVEATDKRHTRVKVYETVVRALEERLGIPRTLEAQPAGEVAQPADQPLAEPGAPAAEIIDQAQPVTPHSPLDVADQADQGAEQAVSQPPPEEALLSAEPEPAPEIAATPRGADTLRDAAPADAGWQLEEAAASPDLPDPTGNPDEEDSHVS